MLLICPTCATSYEIKPTALGADGRSLRCARCHTVWHATPPQEEAAGAADTMAAVATLEKMMASDSAAYTTTPDHAALGQSMPTNTLAEISIPIGEAPPLAPAAHDASHSHDDAARIAAGEDIETFARRHDESKQERAQRLRRQYGPSAALLALALLITALLAWRDSIVRAAPHMASLYASIGLPVNVRQLVFDNVKTSKETRDGAPVLAVEGKIISTATHPVEVPRLRFALRNDAGQEVYSWTAQPERSILAPGAVLSFRSRIASPPEDGRNVLVRFLNRRDPVEKPR
jgi:predicted Zn finger-like uncharacterized protein